MNTNRKSKRFTVTVWHGEHGSIAYVVDGHNRLGTEVVQSFSSWRHGPTWRHRAVEAAETLNLRRAA